MTSSYVPGSFSGGIPNATALSNEFQKIKDALDEALIRNATTGNGMEEDLDLNSHKLINVIKGTDPSDVATIENLTEVVGNLTAFQDLVDDIASLGADVTTLQTSVTALTIQLSLLQNRAHEDRVVEVNASTSPGGFPGRVDTNNSGDDVQLSRAGLHDWVNIYWNATDTSDSSIFGPGSQPRLNFTLVDGTGTPISGESYLLWDGEGNAIQTGMFEPGDTIRGNIQTVAVGGVVGAIRLYKLASAAGVTQAQLTAEMNARITNDNSLDAQLASETTSRQTVDASLSAQISVEEARIDTLVAEQTTQDNQIATAQASITGLTTNVTALQASQATQNTSITDLQNEDIALDARLDIVEAQLPDDDTALTTAIAANLATITSEMADQNLLETQVTTLAGTVATNTTAANTNASGLANEIAARAAADTTQNNLITIESNRNDTQDASITGLTANVVALQGSQATQNTDITALQAGQISNDNEIATAQASITGLTANVVALQGSQGVQDTAIAAVETESAANTAALTTLSAEFQDLRIEQWPLFFTRDPIADGVDMLEFVTAEDWQLQNIGDWKGILNTAPSGGTGVIEIKRNGVVVNTVTFADGATLAPVVTGNPGAAYVVDDVFTMTLVTGNGMQGISITGFRRDTL